MKIEEKDGILSVTNRVIAEVVKEEDEYIKKVILDYPKKISDEYSEEVKVVFIDENIARQIINLGIEEYFRRQKLKG